MKLQFLTLETIRGMDKSFRGNDLWDCLGGGKASVTYDWLMVGK